MSDNLQLLVSTADAVLTYDDPYNLLARIFELLSGYCGLEVCFSFWVAQDRLRLAYCTGVSEEIAAALQWLEFGQAVCGSVARDRCRMTREDNNNHLTPSPTLFGPSAYSHTPVIR